MVLSVARERFTLTSLITYGELFDVEEVNMLWANVPEYLGSMGNTRNHSMVPCDDFLDVYWNDNPLLGDVDCVLPVSGTVGTCAWRNTYIAFDISRSINLYNSSEVFTKPSGHVVTTVWQKESKIWLRICQ